ncbi:MAG: 30S ribosomal protein S6 [Treponemataceae bacterium]|nr:MAG: 30S ribosomal protein S6 [Treponemataceae bacterium]
MKKYELMMIFPLEESTSKEAVDAAKKVLAENGVEIEKEEPFGDRDLSYEVKKHKRARFVLFVLKANPAKIVEIDSRFKLITNIIKFMFVRIDE